MLRKKVFFNSFRTSLRIVRFTTLFKMNTLKENIKTFVSQILVKKEGISDAENTEMELQKKVETEALARTTENIEKSDFLSRDLSWLTFNYRVLDQAKDTKSNVFERLKFMAISASNLDEFFIVRLGSLYNYIDYGKTRIDYSGLREQPFRKYLLAKVRDFRNERNAIFSNELKPIFHKNGFTIIENYNELSKETLDKTTHYFDEIVYPMLTPMLYDSTHAFPILNAKNLIFAVVTENSNQLFSSSGLSNEKYKLSFVQVPVNLPRFYVFHENGLVQFLPIEHIIRANVHKLYRNIKVASIDLFRIVRNGDFTLEESDDIEADFVDEIKQKIKSRRVGRVVRVELEKSLSPLVKDILMQRWEIDDSNFFGDNPLIDYTALWQIIKYPDFQDKIESLHLPVMPLGITRDKLTNIYEAIKEKDIFLHHPYHSFEPVLQLIERAAEDPNVLSIKLTIYRLAKNSRITAALLKAAESGKNVAVLFEIKARFDEENNIREAEKLQKAGCYVIYGIGLLKTHTKLMLIVRKEGSQVVQYAHMASGNYNEDTAKLYTDVGLLTTRDEYTRDISEFFNVITGHSEPREYTNLITSPRDMRNRLIGMIQQEAENAKQGLPSGICIKLNSLEDTQIIKELYEASKAGVQIKLIIRGICCLRPRRESLSENITVRSIVGEYLEHARILYFHNAGKPRVFAGSADMMVRSFDRRIESMFEVIDDTVRQQMIHLLAYNLKDNQNAYELQEDGNYVAVSVEEGNEAFDMHKAFFDVTEKEMMSATLFSDEVATEERSENG